MLEIPILRVLPGPLASTIARAALKLIVANAAQAKRPLIRITDPYLDNLLKDALEDCAFSLTSQGWSKISIPSVTDRAGMISDLWDLQQSESTRQLVGQLISPLADILRAPIPPETVAELEQALWPAKIIGCGLPTYVIPIQPVWAEQLFDEHLASQTLFGAEPQLALSWENTYYRVPRALSKSYNSPFRILWYVSKNPNYQQVGSIRGCSLCLEAEILPIKQAYLKNRRLGIYNFSDIAIIGAGRSNGKVMTMRFSNTELFPNPLKYSSAHSIIE